MPMAASAQNIQNISIGKIAQVDDPAPTMWGMSGKDIFKISQTVNGFTPIMRILACNARTVEILSRTQAPPPRASDVKTLNNNGNQYIAVRRSMLMQWPPTHTRARH